MIDIIFDKIRSTSDALIRYVEEKKHERDLAQIVQKAVPNFDPNFFSTRRQLMTPTGSKVFDRPYEQSVWIYAANKTVSQTASQSPYLFYKKTEEIERDVLPDTHPLNVLFDKPNPMMSRQEIMFATLLYMGLDGEAFWILERNSPTELPENIWCFRKNFFEPEIDDETGLIKWWKFEGFPKILPVENVIQFKYFNPEYHYQGMAPWMAASLSSEQDYYASNYNTNFFKSGASIGGFLETEESLDDDQYNRLLSSIEDRHAGHTKAHKLMLLEGGVSFKEAKLSQRDMEFIETKKLTKAEILAAYGTNPVVLGDFNDVKSEAGVRAILKDFWTRVIIPNQDYIENKMYSEFLKTYDPEINVVFDNSSIEVLQDDLDTLLERAEKLFKIGYSINIINKRLNLGMPEVSHGDFAYLSGINLARVDEDGNLIDPLKADSIDQEDIVVAEEPATDEPDPEATQEEEEIEEEEEKKQLLRQAIKHLAMVKNFEETQEEAEDEWEEYILLFLAAMQLGIFDNLKKLTIENLIGLNDSITVTNLITTNTGSGSDLGFAVAPLWMKNFRTGYNIGAIESGFEYKFSPLDPIYLKFQESKINNVPDVILNTLNKGIAKAVDDVLLAGGDMQDLIDEISAVYEIARNRAKMIATTESTSGLNAGKFAVYGNALSKVKRIRWSTAKDERVRGMKPEDIVSHVALEGNTVVPGQFFKRYGLPTRLRYPGDLLAPPSDIINCRCTIIPLFD